MIALATGTVPASGALPDDDRILNKREVAKLAGISARTLERHEAEGTCPPRVRLAARRVGFWKSDVQQWLRERTGPKKAA